MIPLTRVLGYYRWSGHSWCSCFHIDIQESQEPVLYCVRTTRHCGEHVPILTRVRLAYGMK